MSIIDELGEIVPERHVTCPNCGDEFTVEEDTETFLCENCDTWLDVDLDTDMVSISDLDI